MISPADMVSRGIHTASSAVRPKVKISESKPVERKKIRVAKKDKPPAPLTHIETPDKINKALAMMQIGEDVALEKAVKKNVEKFEHAMEEVKATKKKDELVKKVKKAKETAEKVKPVEHKVEAPKEKKKSRFEKGSEEAKAFMQKVREGRKKKE